MHLAIARVFAEVGAGSWLQSGPFVEAGGAIFGVIH